MVKTKKETRKPLRTIQSIDSFSKLIDILLANLGERTPIITLQQYTQKKSLQMAMLVRRGKLVLCLVANGMHTERCQRRLAALKQEA